MKPSQKVFMTFLRYSQHEKNSGLFFPPKNILTNWGQLKSRNSNYNPGHNILALFNNLVQVRVAKSKTIFDI